MTGRTPFVVALVLSVVAALLLGLFFGGAGLPARAVLDALAGRGAAGDRAIVWELRVPRLALGFLVGGALAVSGAALQALVRNPLADPYLMGLSGGASLGAVIALAVGIQSVWAMPLFAFAGAVVTMVAVYRLALVAGDVLDSRILLLAGVVVGAFAGALTSGILSVTESVRMRSAMLWLLGGLGGVGWPGVLALALYSVPALAVIAREARAMNLLGLGEEPAQFLGADVAATKRRLYIAASLLTAAAVAAAGIIGFIGLLVPHAVRLLRGHDYRVLLPASFVLGGAWLVAADAGARTLFAPLELPVGVVTAVAGVPLFAMLLRRTAQRVAP